MQDLPTDQTQENSYDIDIQELFSVVWSGKVKIVLITLLFAICSFGLALSKPDIYVSKSLLAVVENSGNNSLSSLNSRYGGLAAIAGISLPSTSSGDKGTLAIETIRSRDFLTHLLSFEEVMPKLMATKDYDLTTKEILFDPNLYDGDRKVWLEKSKGGVNSKPSYLATYNTYLEQVSISKDKFSGYVSISFKHKSPEFAHYFLSLIIKEVNSLIREVDLQESSEALNYLNSQLTKTQQSDIKNSINQLIKSKLETQMLANVNKDYVLRPLDKPYVPEFKSEPNRVSICIMGTMLGVMAGFLWVLISHFAPKIRNKA